MKEKHVIGFVIFNKHNQFLLTRTISKNSIDYGLVGKEFNSLPTQEDLINILKQNLCLNIQLTPNNSSILFDGVDNDGKFTIYMLKLDLNANSMYSILNSKTEFLWLSHAQVSKLFSEKRLNVDQLSCISKCYEQIQSKNSLIKAKVISKKKSGTPNKTVYSNPEEEYRSYVKKFTERRIISRLENGRKIKPCGRECYEQGYLIAQNLNHSSFENFKELMNDEEFILSAAEITPNPVECYDYFYTFVNTYLKQKLEFRLKFLKAIYLNLNVYKLEDINFIVEKYNLKAENYKLLNDTNLKKQLETKFDKILKNLEIEYHCSGLSKKELRKYKIDANEAKILLENIKNGLTEIINSFNVGEKISDINFEPTTFYEFICQQSSSSQQEKQLVDSNTKHKSIKDEDYEPTTFYEYICKQSKEKTPNGYNF